MSSYLNLPISLYWLTDDIKEDTGMSKPLFNKHLFKHHDLFSLILAMTVLCLLVSWGIELLAKELFRLG